MIINNTSKRLVKDNHGYFFRIFSVFYISILYLYFICVRKEYVFTSILSNEICLEDKSIISVDKKLIQ